MSALLPPPVLDPPRSSPRRSSRRRPSRRRPRTGVVLTAVVLLVALVASAAVVLHRRWDDAGRDYLAADGWPAQGQAAYAIGGQLHDGPGQRPVPIASLAKVMTAHLVLRALPLHGDEAGPTIVVTGQDVLDTARRRAQQESVVAVRQGERLTERQALMALLLPSANNVAIMLARRVAGGVGAFVDRMNAEARRLGMTRTHYTDPSGFDAATVSTARDQVMLARAVAGDTTLTAMVATTNYQLPVAGTVHNTDTLLGHDAFVGTKTGSDDAAGGCFMFLTYRVVHGRLVDVVGVVLGQRGHSLLAAGLYAARQLVGRVAPRLPG